MEGKYDKAILYNIPTGLLFTEKAISCSLLARNGHFSPDRRPQGPKTTHYLNIWSSLPLNNPQNSIQ